MQSSFLLNPGEISDTIDLQNPMGREKYDRIYRCLHKVRAFETSC